MKTSNGYLTYCTNIHAGEQWDAHFAALRKFFPAIKKSVSPDEEMGIGLRLSNEASIALAEPASLEEFRKWLQQENGYVFTMNGFPYGGFHHTIVKEHVHSPDWTTEDRVDYTIRLFDILKQLLPDGMDGGISTSPLTYRHWHSTADDKARAEATATANIVRVIRHLIDIRNTTGQILHLDVEPEPDGLLESGDEFITWFDGALSNAAIPTIRAAYEVNAEEAASLLRDHLRLCYDVCHFAIGYESHTEVIEKLFVKGIQIGKIQISAALKVEMGEDATGRKDIREAFAPFNESTYLHQVVALQRNGEMVRYPDLPEALADIDRKETKEWRAHFHVPIFRMDFGLLQSTQDDITQVLEIQKLTPLTNHLEVETYTWEVLPADVKLDLQESIIRELQWVKNNL